MIRKIDPLIEAGGIVDRLRVGVCRQECQVRGFSFDGDLPRVVVRVSKIYSETVVDTEGGSEVGPRAA